MRSVARPAATIYRRYNVGLSQVLRHQRSADIVDYDRIDVAPTVLAGVLGLVALAALVYSLAASTRPAGEISLCSMLSASPGGR